VLITAAAGYLQPSLRGLEKRGQGEPSAPAQPEIPEVAPESVPGLVGDDGAVPVHR
jgi:hypothetical protein